MQLALYYLPFPDKRIYNVVVDIVLRVNPADKVLLLHILNALYAFI